MTRRLPCLVAALAVGAVVTAAPSVARVAAPDTTPPTLNLPARGSFVPLSTITATTFDSENGWPEATGVEMRLQWSATDASGVCGYRVREVDDEGPRAWSAWGNRTTSVTRSTSDYDDQEGGGVDKFWGYDVQVRDCAGNTSLKFSRLAPVVYQQDGLSYRYGTLDVTTTGSWATTSCACWSAGTALKTVAKGARINFAMPEDTIVGVPYVVALVMERAPDRGKAQVLIDDVVVATIDTRASTKVHRSIVWSGTLVGNQTLSVVNLATNGRPRIDVDAVVSSANV